MEIKLNGYSVEFNRDFLGLLALGEDTVAVAAVVACASSRRSGVIWYWVDRKENLPIGLVGGSG